MDAAAPPPDDDVAKPPRRRASSRRASWSASLVASTSLPGLHEQSSPVRKEDLFFQPHEIDQARAEARKAGWSCPSNGSYRSRRPITQISTSHDAEALLSCGTHLAGVALDGADRSAQQRRTELQPSPTGPGTNVWAETTWTPTSSALPSPSSALPSPSCDATAGKAAWPAFPPAPPPGGGGGLCLSRGMASYASDRHSFQEGGRAPHASAARLPLRRTQSVGNPPSNNPHGLSMSQRVAALQWRPGQVAQAPVFIAGREEAAVGTHFS